MALKIAQYAVLKADILANTDLNSNPNTLDGAFEIARLYNINKVPDFTVWKTLVPIGDVGKSINGVEWGNLTTANSNRLSSIAAYLFDGVDPSRSDIRSLYDDIFSVGGATITSLNILWRRLAKRVEALYAVGTGTDIAPASLVFEGDITPVDVLQARNS